MYLATVIFSDGEECLELLAEVIKRKEEFIRSGNLGVCGWILNAIIDR